jgi:hypothetical protein
MTSNLKEIDPSLFAPWGWTGSIIITPINWAVNILTLCSILPIIDLAIPKKLKIDKLWPREVFVISVAVLPTLSMVLLNPKNWVQVLISVMCLLNVCGAILRDLIVAPQKHSDHQGSYILVRSRLRWFLIAPFQAYSIIICFAIMFLDYGNQFNPIISDSLTAIYQSTLTFTTLGYGDIKPICFIGKVLVISELFFFFLFIGIKLPISASLVRVKKVLQL